MTTRASRGFNLIMMAVGGVGLVLLLRSAGSGLWDQLTGAAGSFPAVLALAAAGGLCDAAALHAFMRPEARTVSYARSNGAIRSLPRSSPG